MANNTLQGWGNRRVHGGEFGCVMVIEASYEDTTHVAVVDYDKPICYLHEWDKAWHFR